MYFSDLHLLSVFLLAQFFENFIVVPNIDRWLILILVLVCIVSCPRAIWLDYFLPPLMMESVIQMGGSQPTNESEQEDATSTDSDMQHIREKLQERKIEEAKLLQEFGDKQVYISILCMLFQLCLHDFLYDWLFRCLSLLYVVGG